VLRRWIIWWWLAVQVAVVIQVVGEVLEVLEQELL